MALSMDEQRILAEIEQRLAETEPGLAARFSALGRTRSARAAPRAAPPLLLAIIAAVVMAAVAMVVYTLVAVRGSQSSQGHGRPPSSPQAPAIGPRTSSSRQAGAASARPAP